MSFTNTRSKCDGCGKDIIWAEMPDPENPGRMKRIPLDPRPAVYRLTGTAKCERDKDCLVTHFATCPKVDQFSSSHRQSKSNAPAPAAGKSPRAAGS